MAKVELKQPIVEEISNSIKDAHLFLLSYCHFCYNTIDYNSTLFDM